MHDKPENFMSRAKSKPEDLYTTKLASQHLIKKKGMLTGTVIL